VKTYFRNGQGANFIIVVVSWLLTFNGVNCKRTVLFFSGFFQDQFILSICLSIVLSSCDSYLNNEEEWSFVSAEKLTGKWAEIRIKGDDETMSLFITDDWSDIDDDDDDVRFFDSLIIITSTHIFSIC